MTETDYKQLGFEIYRTGKVKRISSTQFLVKMATAPGWFLAELQGSKWQCDCGTNNDVCEHVFASQLTATAARTQLETKEELSLRCRYCGSPDVSSTGYRYNAYGISRRYKCNECLRKYSIKFVEGREGRVPSETLWLLSEIGMVLNKLEDLIEKLGKSFLTENATSQQVNVEPPTDAPA